LSGVPSTSASGAVGSSNDAKPAPPFLLELMPGITLVKLVLIKLGLVLLGIMPLQLILQFWVSIFSLNFDTGASSGGDASGGDSGSIGADRKTGAINYLWFRLFNCCWKEFYYKCL